MLWLEGIALRDVLGGGAGLLALVLAGCATLLMAWVVLEAAEAAVHRARLRQQAQRIAQDCGAVVDEAARVESFPLTRQPWWGRPLLRSRGRSVELLPLCELYPFVQRLPHLLERAGLGDSGEGLVQWWLLATCLGAFMAWAAGSFPLACAALVLSLR